MCFGGGGGGGTNEVQEVANKAAASERVEAETAKRDEIERRAKQKREDISEAITKKEQGKGMRGGAGRRSLFKAGGSGFMGRFD
jgi:hypothetical protein